MSHCIRQIVAEYGKTSSIPEKKQPFLQMGHNFQDGVEKFIMDNLDPLVGYLMKEYREAEGRHLLGDIEVPGHVDGVLRLVRPSKETEGLSQYVLLEVKAIQEGSYKALKKTTDFLEKYPQYRAQAQTYMSFPELIQPLQKVGSRMVVGGNSIKGPFETTVFVFVNRNTSEMLGGLPGIDHPAYTMRKDMVLKRDPGWLDVIERRINKAVGHIIAPGGTNIPEQCDQVGYCFYCKKAGEGEKDILRTGRAVTLGPDDGKVFDDVKPLMDALAKFPSCCSLAVGAFDRLKAREITLEYSFGSAQTLSRQRLEDIMQKAAEWA